MKSKLQETAHLPGTDNGQRVVLGADDGVVGDREVAAERQRRGEARAHEDAAPDRRDVVVPHLHARPRREGFKAQEAGCKGSAKLRVEYRPRVLGSRRTA